MSHNTELAKLNQLGSVNCRRALPPVKPDGQSNSYQKPVERRVKPSQKPHKKLKTPYSLP